jgi:hypothetical protein
MTVEEYLAQFRKNEDSVERSVELWLLRDRRNKNTYRKLGLVDRAAKEKANVKANRMRLAKERHRAQEREREAAGLAPDGKPYISTQCIVEACLRGASPGSQVCVKHDDSKPAEDFRFLQAAPRAQQGPQ